MTARFSALTTGRTPLPRNIIFLSLVLTSVRSWVNPGAMVRLQGLGKLKKKIINVIGTRTRDLPACNIVSHPNTLPRAPLLRKYNFLKFKSSNPSDQIGPTHPRTNLLGSGSCLVIWTYRVFRNSFTTVFQMLLCGECYENVTLKGVQTIHRSRCWSVIIGRGVICVAGYGSSVRINRLHGGWVRVCVHISGAGIHGRAQQHSTTRSARGKATMSSPIPHALVLRLGIGSRSHASHFV
jgi:hypothetical protein